MKLSLRTLSFLAFPALAACSNFSLGSSTSGSDTGRVNFTYESGDCFFGCAIAPMMLGTTETMNADLLSPAAGVAVTVDDPTVVRVTITSTTCCSTSGSSTSCTSGPVESTTCTAGQKQSLSLSAVALSTGSTKLHVVQGGTEIDGIGLQVELPAQIALSCGQKPDAQLAVGANCVVDWSVSDAQGGKLQASQGISLAHTDAGVAGIVQLFGGPEQNLPNAQIGFLASAELQGLAPGQTQLVATVNGLSASLPVKVTP